MAVAALPEESITARVTPSSVAAVARTEAPRSLNDPVGMKKSHLRETPASRADSTSGVIPSPRLTLAPVRVGMTP